MARTAKRTTKTARKGKPRRKPVPRGRVLDAMSVIEDALIDLSETVFLLDQIEAHGEAFDDQGRAFRRIARLIVADMAALWAEYSKAQEAMANNTPVERKPMEGAE